MLRERAMPPAVIAVNDQIAFGLIRAAQEHGLMLGKDYAISGFDDEAASPADWDDFVAGFPFEAACDRVRAVSRIA